MKKLGHPLAILFIIIVCLLMICWAYNYIKNVSQNPVNESKESSPLKIEHYDSQIRIMSFAATQGVIFSGDTVRATVSIKNSGAAVQKIWMGYSLQDSVGKWYDVEPQALTVTPKKIVKADIKWIVPEDVVTGDYTMVLGLWDNRPEQSAKRLASATLTKRLRIYHVREDFAVWHEDQWLANNSELGRSTLKSENVVLQDGNLLLKLPTKTLDGAEIQTTEKVHYGSYEARMKLPAAPSSITGFFLYTMPDYYHEIDIEIYNQAEADLLLTTYARGKKEKIYQQPLSFDPTADFHTYRIDYLPYKVEFFIDDILMQTWSQGFTNEPMYLMVNVWYPRWLEGLPAETDGYLLVDWILK